MAASEFLIVLCSPNSARSTWVNREVAWFKTHRDPFKILTVIVGGEPMASLIPGREAEECFPKTLLYKVGVDLQPTEEIGEAPLAADARDTGDGKRGAKLKLAAAMLGLGLDHLVRRDDRRRAARRRLVMGAMAASIAVLGGLTVFAFNQRNAAQIAQKDAEFQTSEAQDLVEFMLTDLRQRLDAVGRLDILDAVAKRLDESYAKQDLSKLDADALGRRARVQLLLGEVDNTRGNLDAALAQYKKAAATTEELLNRNPAKAQQIFDHAQSIFWVGYIAWQRGDAAEAKKYFTQYKDYADQLVAIDPDKEEWQAEVEYANSNLGTLALDQGEAAEAEDYFKKALEVSEALAANHPDDVERKLALAESYSWFAQVKFWLADFSSAKQALLHEDAILTLVLSNDAKNQQAADRKQRNQRVQASVALAMGDMEFAKSTLLRLVQEQRELVSKDPENIQRLSAYGWLLADLCDLQINVGDVQEAEKALELVLKVAATIAQIDPTIRQSDIFIGKRAELFRAQLAFAKNDIPKAQEILEEFSSFGIIGMMHSQSSRPDEIGLESSLRLLLSKIYMKTGDDANAKKAATESIARLEPIKSRLNPSLLFRLAEAYELAGSLSQAHSIAADLYRRGYRHPEFMALLESFPDLKSPLNADVAR